MRLTDLLWILGLGLAFVVLERLAPGTPGRPLLRRGWKADLAHVFLGGPVVRPLMTAVAVAAALLGGPLIPAAWAEAVRSQPVWLQYVEILILAELNIYAAHRAAHAVPALWRLHAVHHSSVDLDWASAHRIHPLEHLLFEGPALALFVIVGFAPEALIAYGLIYRVHALLVHANVSLRFGPLEHLVVTPHFHHWHHADEKAAYDRNFAGQLAVLDHLFGSFRLPATGRPERYGVGDPVPDGYIGQLAFPFQGAGEAGAPVPEPAQLKP